MYNYTKKTAKALGIKKSVKRAWRTCKVTTASIRIQPSVIVVGAQKSGTTSLFNDICGCKNFIKPEKKEIRYFGTKYDNSTGWYESHFPIKQVFRKKYTCEATPYYLYHAKSSKRIKRYDNEIKIIIILRDPVERAISHYNWEEKLGNEDKPLDEALFDRHKQIKSLKSDKGDEYYDTYYALKYSYIDRGFYYRQVKRYIDDFGRSNVVVIKSEDYFNKNSKVQEAIEEKLPNVTVKLDYPKLQHNEKKAQVSKATRQRLQNIYDRENKRLFELLDLEKGWWSYSSTTS